MEDKISPAYFIQFLVKNIDNNDLTDEQFRRFVRDNLSMVTGSGYAPERDKLERLLNSISNIEDWFADRVREANVSSFEEIRQALLHKVQQLKNTTEACGLTADNKIRALAEIEEFRTAIINTMTEKLRQTWMGEKEQLKETTIPEPKDWDEVLTNIGRRLGLSKEDVVDLQKIYGDMFRRPRR